MDRSERIAALESEARRRILVMDGAMGTMIQARKLSEYDFRGDRFVAHGQDLIGDNDLLSLTQPEVIREIHQGFLDAGADIICTNTFNATRISQGDYALEGTVYEINYEGALRAREAVDALFEDEGRRALCAGSLGPTNRTASISPDVNDAGKRNTSFDELREAYLEAGRGLAKGGADILLVETIFDTLNAKAALFAIDELFEEIGERLAVMISGTITDLSGRTLSGQTTEAFWNSVRHAKPFSVGLNCSLGAKELRPYVSELSRIADCYVSAYPNAGLPNAFGGYDETPTETATHLGEWAESGLVNIVGGCCGTTPAHIAALAQGVSGAIPREIPAISSGMRLSGLEPFEVQV